MSTSWNERLTGLVVACLALTAAVQAAVLEGQTVATEDYHGTAPEMTVIIGPVYSVVGPRTELMNFGWDGFLNIDFSDTNILITAARNQPAGYFELIRFADTRGSIPDFVTATVNPATNWAGFNGARIYVYPDRIDVNLTALHGLQGQQISLDITAAPHGLLGDLNCDAVVDFDDINPFVLALGDPGGYQTAFPKCDISNGDINRDGRIDFDDVNPFVALLGLT